jgi:hypothetical protein
MKEKEVKQIVKKAYSKIARKGGNCYSLRRNP